MCVCVLYATFNLINRSSQTHGLLVLTPVYFSSLSFSPFGKKTAHTHETKQTENSRNVYSRAVYVRLLRPLNQTTPREEEEDWLHIAQRLYLAVCAYVMITDPPKNGGARSGRGDAARKTTSADVVACCCSG